MRVIFLLTAFLTSFASTVMGAYYIFAKITPEVAKPSDLSIGFNSFLILGLVAIGSFLFAELLDGEEFSICVDNLKKKFPTYPAIYSLFVSAICFYFHHNPSGFAVYKDPAKMKAVEESLAEVSYVFFGIFLAFVGLSALSKKLGGFSLFGRKTALGEKVVQINVPNNYKLDLAPDVAESITSKTKTKAYSKRMRIVKLDWLTLKVERRLNTDKWVEEVKRVLELAVPKEHIPKLKQYLREIHVINGKIMNIDGVPYGGHYWLEEKTILLNYDMAHCEANHGFFSQVLLHEIGHAYDQMLSWHLGKSLWKHFREPVPHFMENLYDSIDEKEFWAEFFALYQLSKKANKGRALRTWFKPNKEFQKILSTPSGNDCWLVQNNYPFIFEAVKGMVDSLDSSKFDEICKKALEQKKKVPETFEAKKYKMSKENPKLLQAPPDGINAKIPSVDISNLSLDEEMKDNLQNLVFDYQGAEKVKFGFEDGNKDKEGDIYLFAGESGTGKTYCAEAIAGELSRILWTLNLGKIKSKWAGETEGMLEEILTSAQKNNVVLFIDECDFLLQNRDSDSSNWQKQLTNVVLQNTDPYNGLLILATNLKDDIDGAMKSRISEVITFKKPPTYIVEQYFEEKFKLKGSNGKPTPLEEGFSVNEALEGLEPSMRDAKNTLKKVSKHLNRTQKPLSTEDFRSLLIKSIGEEAETKLAS